MKKLVLLLIGVIFSCLCLSNVPPNSEAVITEICFNSNGDWTLEIYFNYFSEWDDYFRLISLTDTAILEKFPDSTGFLIITQNDLQGPFTIDPNGDVVQFYDDEWSYIAWPFTFGNIAGSSVNPPLPDQVILNANHSHDQDNFEVKGNYPPGIGQLQDPPTGLFHGYVYDSLGNPIKYFHIQHETGYGIVESWTDSTGYFYNPTILARNYNVTLEPGYGNPWVDTMITIEPDSTVYLVFELPLTAQVNINGYCNTQGAATDSGITVILTPEYEYGPVYYTTTDSNGYYELNVPAGRYYIRFSKEGFLPEFSNYHIDFYTNKTLSTYQLQPGNVNEISIGEVNGIWDSEYPYWIFGKIEVPAGDTLLILPGTQIDFKRNGNFTTYGTLLAQGEETNPIWFVNSDFEAIRIYGEGASGSTLDHLAIPICDSGIIINNASPSISNCTAFHDEQYWRIFYRIKGNSAPLIKNTRIVSDYYNVRLFYIEDSAAPVISHHEFKDYSFYWGIPLITVTDNANPLFCNNVFHNLGRCIYSIFHYGTIHSINNIFHKNDMVYTGSYGNQAYNSKYNIFYDSFMSWSQIAPGHGEITQINLNGDSCDIYYNLFMDPMFADSANDNFHLTENSPCIDAGDPAFAYDPDSTIADMGAYYFDQLSIGTPNNTPYLNPGYEITISPNPNNGDATIILQKEEHLSWNNARIRLFDLNGDAIAIEEIEYLLPQDNKYTLDLLDISGTILSAGSYILSLEISNRIIVSRKIIIN